MSLVEKKVFITVKTYFLTVINLKNTTVLYREYESRFGFCKIKLILKAHNLFERQCFISRSLIKYLKSYCPFSYLYVGFETLFNAFFLCSTISRRLTTR